MELGCGSGDLTHGLAPLVDRLHAVDPSEGMLAVAQRRMPGARNVHWFAESAESFEPECSYALAVAAESLHWMDWERVLPEM